MIEKCEMVKFEPRQADVLGNSWLKAMHPIDCCVAQTTGFSMLVLEKVVNPLPS